MSDEEWFFGDEPSMMLHPHSERTEPFSERERFGLMVMAAALTEGCMGRSPQRQTRISEQWVEWVGDAVRAYCG